MVNRVKAEQSSIKKKKNIFYRIYTLLYNYHPVDKIWCLEMIDKSWFY